MQRSLQVKEPFFGGEFGRGQLILLEMIFEDRSLGL
jgi:hypothetical protein